MFKFIFILRKIHLRLSVAWFQLDYFFLYQTRLADHSIFIFILLVSKDMGFSLFFLCLSNHIYRLILLLLPLFTSSIRLVKLLMNNYFFFFSNYSDRLLEARQECYVVAPVIIQSANHTLNVADLCQATGRTLTVEWKI